MPKLKRELHALTGKNDSNHHNSGRTRSGHSSEQQAQQAFGRVKGERKSRRAREESEILEAVAEAGGVRGKERQNQNHSFGLLASRLNPPSANVDREWIYDSVRVFLDYIGESDSGVDLELVADDAEVKLEEGELLYQPVLTHGEEAHKTVASCILPYLPEQGLSEVGEEPKQSGTLLEPQGQPGERRSPRPAAKTKMAQIPQVQATPMLGQFLNTINGFLKSQNEQGLANSIPREPPFSQNHETLISELRQAFPSGQESALEDKCSAMLTVARDGVDGSPSWSQFTRFIVQYLRYIRDLQADEDKYFEIYEMLYELQKRANSALTHASLGSLMLPIVVGFAKVICRLAIFIDNNPEKFAHLKPSRGGGQDDGPTSTLPERAAELLRSGLTTCLNDRESALDEDGKPQGKKRGIYLIANICLKIFFQCRKTRNASMIFTNIGNLSPPLSAYPKSQRITYLYYLGRFWFQNSHFDRAQLALQSAYDECPVFTGCIKQRRHILIFLIASSIILGRFPTAAIFGLPEAQGLDQRFLPLMQAIRSGNLAQFRHHLDWNGPHAAWFLHFRILLQLRDRCEVFVWRSLVRKTWLLCGTPYVPGGQPPLVDINSLVILFSMLEEQAQKPEEAAWVDPDFDGTEDHGENYDLLAVTPMKVESILTSLVTQGFVQGFIAHRQSKFVFTGVKQAGGDVLAACFPPPWNAVGRKLVKDGFRDEVPGWKRRTTLSTL